MQLVCNELSFYPLAENIPIAEERFTSFFNTFKEAKKKYGFTHIWFPIKYSELPFTTDKTFYEMIMALSNQTIKGLILSLCKAPYIDNLDEQELNTYYESDYAIVGEDVPVVEQPVGLPVSYIKSLPSISFDAHIFWRNRKIIILKTNGVEIENVEFVAYNICLKNDINTNELTEWADKSIPAFVTTEDILRKYLSYIKYRVIFTADFMTQFYQWKTDDFDSFKYLLLLMKDVQLHPFTGGMGQTENLKKRGKEASKRVTHADRLSYEVENDVVKFIACKGHYDFH